MIGNNSEQTKKFTAEIFSSKKFSQNKNIFLYEKKYWKNLKLTTKNLKLGTERNSLKSFKYEK